MNLNKDLISSIRGGQLVAPATTSDSDNQSGTELDIGTTKEGTFIVSITKGTTGLTGVGLYTDVTTGFTEAVGNRVTLTQDTVNSTGTVTLTTNEFDLDTTGIYIFNAKDLKRFVNVEYDGDDADSIISMIFIGHNLGKAPYAAATSAYT